MDDTGRLVLAALASTRRYFSTADNLDLERVEVLRAALWQTRS